MGLGNTYSNFFGTTYTPGLHFPDRDKSSRSAGELAMPRPKYIKSNSKSDSTGKHCLKQDGCSGGKQRLHEEAVQLYRNVPIEHIVANPSPEIG
tara:strand:- start:3519 stop:3800 length:282 start_codon:yes stop_codon:yes gene_type:complete